MKKISSPCDRQLRLVVVPRGSLSGGGARHAETTSALHSALASTLQVMDHLPEVCLTHTSRTVVHRGAAAQLRRAHLAYGEGGNVLSLHNPDPVRSRRCAPDNGVMRKVRATRKLYATTRWTPTRPLRAWMLNFLPIQMIAIGNAGRDFQSLSSVFT